MIYIIQEERNQGVGKQLGQKLLPLPPNIQAVKTHTIAKSRASTIIQKIFDLKPIYTRDQYYMFVRQFDFNRLEEEISVLENFIDKNNIELLSLNSNNYYSFSSDYASIMEYIWNKKSSEPELFLVRDCIEGLNILVTKVYLLILFF